VNPPRPWWLLDAIREWNRSGFLPFDEWPVPWRRAAGLAGVTWILIASAAWLIGGNAGTLALVSPYVGAGLAYLVAVIADRDRRWRRNLARVQWVTIVLFASAIVVALRDAP
jgi:hypothetical protein